jgi:hypothetical protein
MRLLFIAGRHSGLPWPLGREPRRQGLALEDKPSGECIFLEGNDCAINSVKPQQCREFPNLWNFPGFREVCRAKEIALDHAEYKAAILRATGREI